MANIFDRMFGRDLNARAQLTNEDGSPYSGGVTNLTGLWASSLTRNTDLNAIRPSRDETLTASAVAARCVDLFVQAASSRPFEIVTAAGEPVTHVLEKLFNENPNSSQSAVVFWSEFWTLMTTRGEAFIVLDRGANRVGDPKSAFVHYGDVKVRITKPTAFAPHGEIVAFEVPIGKEKAILAPSEVVWARYPDAAQPWAARAPMAAALDAIGISKAARTWQAGQLANAGNPTGILYLGAGINQEQNEAAAIEAEAVLSGSSSAGRLLTLAGAEKPEFIRTSFTAQEVGYLDTLGAAGEDIALALGVPLDLVGGQRTYANVEASRNLFWQDTVLPRLAVVSSEINRQLLNGTGLKARFKTDDVEALQEGKDAVAARVSKAVELDFLTLDEARATLGYDPMEGGLGSLTLSAYREVVAPKAVTPATPASPVRLSNELEIAERTITPDDTQTAVREAPVASEGQTDIISVRGVTEEVANRSLDRLEVAAQRGIRRLAEAQRKDAKKRLNRSNRSVDVPADIAQVFNQAAWLERASEYVLPALFAAMDAGSSETAAGIGLDITVDNYITQAAEDRAAVLADLVNGTTAKVISERLAAAAVADRITVKEFANILDSAFDDLAGYRAEAIARTEMVGSYNAGSRAVAVKSGVVLARQWLTAGDARTRESHMALNGVRTVSMDDPYPNGLMFPGDPNGSASETVNCRCVEQYVTDFTPERTN